MKSIIVAAGALALLLPSGSAAAQPAPAAAAASPVDPTRLAAARATVDRLFPDGTYARMMKGSMDTILGSIMDSAAQLPLRDLAGIGGMTEADLKKLGDTTLAQVMEIYDPAYRQRIDIGMRLMMGEMGQMMGQFEPEIRDGLSLAYARRFSAEQLTEMNRFFATPAGSAYAAESMAIFMSPEVMQKMQSMMPRMMQAMGPIVKKVEAATAGLPKPRKLEELSSAERAKLAKLLGVAESELPRRRR